MTRLVVRWLFTCIVLFGVASARSVCPIPYFCKLNAKPWHD
jgi:hypothetical protein